jgi:hypothetical protein
VNKPRTNPELLLRGVADPMFRASHSKLAAVIVNQREQVVSRLGQEAYETQSSQVRKIIRELQAELHLPLTVVAVAVFKSAAELGADTGLVLASLADELAASVGGV